MYSNEQTFIISVYTTVMSMSICSVRRPMALFSSKKTVLGVLVQVLWYHSPHLMHLAMFADRPSGIRQMQKWGLEMKP